MKDIRARGERIIKNIRMMKRAMNIIALMRRTTAVMSIKTELITPVIKILEGSPLLALKIAGSYHVWRPSIFI
jgi:hypothetical protein